MKHRLKFRNLKRRTTGSLVIEHNRWLVRAARERLKDEKWGVHYIEVASYIYEELHR